MKKLLLCLSLFLSLAVFSQVPKAFKYQAVIRNNSGNSLQNKRVGIRISILQNTVSGKTVYQETHADSTNDFGLVNLEVGNGTPFLGIFDTINWSAGPYYLKIEVDQSGGASYQTMGTAQLLSVPYAIYSDKTNKSDKLEVMPNSSLSSDSALFLVKDKLGRPVFGVYEDGAIVYVNEGAKGGRGGFAVGGRRPGKATVFEDIFRVTQDSVRIYINDTAVHKGGRGGFAVGGRKPSKGTVNEYLTVTPDSTRIYINDVQAKGGRGGFAVGGRKPMKGPGYDYLRVTPDSTRVYVNEPTGKGGRGGFAVGGRKPTKGNPEEYFNISSNDSTDVTIINPSKPRIFWYPRKAAFLTGRVLVENPDSVGTNSMATGYESKAIGNWSQALGYKTIARGNYSMAIGKNALAKSNNSYALGNGAQALNTGAYAFGTTAIASGSKSYAFGNNSNASYDDSYAFGLGAQANAIGSYAIGSMGRDSTGNPSGINTRTTGNYSLAFGMGAQASGYGSISFGVSSNASTNNYSFALGFDSRASGFSAFGINNRTGSSSGNYTVAVGYGTNASGHYSCAIGGARSVGLHSTAIGDRTEADGDYSIAIGSGYASCSQISCHPPMTPPCYLCLTKLTATTGMYSISIGHNTQAKAYASIAMGTSNLAYGDPLNWVDTDPLFVIGNGYNDNYSNALTILKNGNIGIGNDNPDCKLHLTSSLLSSSTGDEDNWAKFSGYCGSWVNVDQLRIFHRRYSYGDDWTSAEIRIQKRVDITDMAYISFKTDYLEFGNGTNPQMTIDVYGNVGIGTTSPGYKLQVGDYADGSQARSNGWYLLSDVKLKKNLILLKNPIEKLSTLNGYYFYWNTGKDTTRQIGISAQEVKAIMPEIVSTDNKGILSVDYGKLAPLLIEAIKEQQKQIETQKKDIDELKTLVNTLIASQTIQGNK